MIRKCIRGISNGFFNEYPKTAALFSARARTLGYCIPSVKIPLYSSFETPLNVPTFLRHRPALRLVAPPVFFLTLPRAVSRESAPRTLLARNAQLLTAPASAALVL